MSEHKIGDQWIEVIDGKRHMVKAVKGKCERCVISHTCNLSVGCHMELGLIAKDLGVLNEDGLLPCPFCGEYPLVENAYEGVSGHNTPDGFWRISCFGKNHEMAFFSGKTKQQAIDAWNRRI